MLQKKLIGHSGCKILLCELDTGEIFVRKISKGISYNERLKNQAKKQKEFSGIGVKAPKIYQTGYTDKGLYFFDMEYIKGITLAEYIKTIEINKIRNIVEVLLKNIFHNGKGNGTEQDVFIQKILSLNKILNYLNNSIINEAVHILLKHDWKQFTDSKCHGDLTLENIIIKEGEIYFIDFLDSFYDSWLLDIGAILQDVQVMWAYREDTLKRNTIIRLRNFQDILIDTIKVKMGDEYIEIYYALLLKMLRIYPYIRDKETIDFCDKKIQMIMKEIKEKEESKIINYSL